LQDKEQHLKTLNGDLIAGDYVDRTVTKTTIEFLQINIDELKRILQDVEQCKPSLPGEGNNYENW
jgi:hypothetical protein